MSDDEFVLSKADLAALSTEPNPYLAEPQRALQLLMDLAAGPAPPAPGVFALEQLFAEGLGALAGRTRVPVMADVASGLQAAIDAIRDLLAFRGLANRPVVGIGGAFSAGKSRFLNSLAGASLLPEDLGPCTVIPTYLAHGDGQSIALSAFGRQVALDSDALAALSHAFSRQHGGDRAPEGLSHLVTHLMVTHGAVPWRRLAFLDTPGYNAVGGDGGSRDANVARRQLGSVDHLVWLVSARNGGLRADDIGFLRACGYRKPVFFVLTQVDLVAPGAVAALLDGVRTGAATAGIACAGAMAWSAPPGAVGAACRRDGDDIHSWLDRIDAAPRFPLLQRRCLDLIDRYRMQCKRTFATQRALLMGLNELQLLAGAAGSGRHPELDAELRCLRQGQMHRDAVTAELDAFRTGVANAVGALLGPFIEDAPQGESAGLLVEISRAAYVGGVAPGIRLPVRVVATRTELKHVLVSIPADAAAGECRLPFSSIRQCWGVDPLTLGADSELVAQWVASTDAHHSFSIHHLNHQQAGA